jgi:nicotinamide-nucleotide amidase
MKKACIVSIGNELLNGSGVDTNSTYLSERLLSIGIPVVSVRIVGDDCDVIVGAFRAASEEADIIVTTGGLGPTDDDLTRQAISKYCGKELILDEKSLADIEEFFARRGRQMSQRNRTQAYIPAGAEVLQNNIGTAPGIMLSLDSRRASSIQHPASILLFVLPGVPVEMKQMFEKFVLPKLLGLDGRKATAVRKLKCFGIGESNIAELLGERMKRGRNPLVNTTVRDGVITVHIIASRDDRQRAETTAESEMSQIAQILGDCVFAMEDINLAEAVGIKLTEMNKKVAVAESCTGGLVSKLLTDVPGSSNYFLCGWVTYSNESKIREFGIEPELVEKKGAVSEEVAAAMAVGALDKARSDYAIGITGIAGPGGATADKSVGLVYISLAKTGQVVVERYFFGTDRNSIRKRTANAALDLLRRNI